ncbi:DUF1735 and LamG domain-containing protein [Proteiniphilum sp. UBA5384]|uniref:DUF1735 and LamG domain-containing protein n=1 Tax=Proteiniphilum sp. UBA5384 TaxID=1947279 RepID=UPI0025CFB122|nr:DUF1735 and LamG domain-containing protein [Proteiniphilum sp. UBA5384]
MKRYSIYIMLLAMLLVVSCQSDNDSFDNKLYIKSNTKVGEILFTGGDPDQEKVLQAEMAMPAEQDIKITYGVDNSLVDTYNEAYYETAELLPAGNYEWIETESIIYAGTVLSTESRILFKEFSQLDRDKVYVLPVTISDTNIAVLKSARTYYYVVRGASLINVVADIDENYLSVKWTNPSVCNNLTQVTMEALIRVRNFDKMISTIMGIEGSFLIRIGDANFPSNQIQIATNFGNFPSSDVNKGLPVNEWVHVALTFDASSRTAIIYVNGKKQSEDFLYISTVNLGNNNFFIGRSYDDNRWLAGEISECRIWNIIRSQEEIANNPYSVDPDSEGLVAYWKFDEGAGSTVKDHSGNGNNALANNTLKWTPVKLPAPGQ